MDDAKQGGRAADDGRSDAGALLALAESIAREAGALLLERFGTGLRATASKSSPTDLVSEADLATEQLIRGRLARERPADAILGEEGGDTGGTSGIRWVVDPLDGTINFLYGIPQWGVSIAAEAPGGEALAGVVYDPVLDELWSAGGGRALLNGEPVEASGETDLATALVATGFGYEAHVREAQAAVVDRLLPQVRDIRRLGSAALDLCWTAAGRYDAYFERGVKPWDVAAGLQLCRAAGLAVHELPEAPGAPRGVLVAAPRLATRLLTLVE